MLCAIGRRLYLLEFESNICFVSTYFDVTLTRALRPQCGSKHDCRESLSPETGIVGLKEEIRNKVLSDLIKGVRIEHSKKEIENLPIHSWQISPKVSGSAGRRDIFGIDHNRIAL